MKKLREIKHAWIWEKDGVSYKATLYKNTFTIKNVNLGGSTILRIRNLASDSQSNIIKNMHRIKLSLGCDL